MGAKQLRVILVGKLLCSGQIWDRNKMRNNFESSVCSANLLRVINVFVCFDFAQEHAPSQVGVAPVKVALHLLF